MAEQGTVTLAGFAGGTMLRADKRTKEGRAQKVALELGLIQPHGPNRYRLTDAGRAALAVPLDVGTGCRKGDSE